MVWKGGIRRGQTQKAPPAAPSTVRLGGATERYRWEAGAGGERRARSAHSHARELGKAVRSAVSFAGMPGLAGSGVAREARARGVGGEGGKFCNRFLLLCMQRLDTYINCAYLDIVGNLLA